MTVGSEARLLDGELKARLSRLIAGDMRVGDVARLFAGKRFSTYGHASFREIGDFAAHPDKRDKGPVTGRMRDMLTTFRPMFDRMINKNTPDMARLLARAESNLRMATDEQLREACGGMGRKRVAQILKAGLEKARRGQLHLVDDDEVVVLSSLGDRVIWNPAFRADDVFDDFRAVMVKNGLLGKADMPKLAAARDFIVLYAIVAMHGTAFMLDDDLGGELQAGFENEFGCLEITALLTLAGYEIPLSMKVGLLWTDLAGEKYCGASLRQRPGPWNFPIEIQDGVIEPIGDVPSPEPDAEKITFR